MKEGMIYLALTRDEAEAIKRCLLLFATIKLYMSDAFSSLPDFKNFDAFTKLSSKFKLEKEPTQPTQPRSKDESILDFYEQDMRGPGNGN